MTFSTWVASMTYGQFRRALIECSVGLAVALPRAQEKRALEVTVKRWVLESKKPTSDRKRNRQEAQAGRRFLALLARNKVDW